VSSKKMGLRRVGIVGLSTLVAASMMTLSAGTAQAAWAGSGGQIGLVDTSTTTAATQGATMVFPGVNGQALGSIRLLIPNTFQNGDTIDLTVFDRTATASNAGQINADAAHKLGFTAAPTVAVGATPWDAATTIGPTSGTVGNTEATPVAATTPGQATTAPVFAASVVQSSRANGLATDIIRLRVNGVQAAGRAADKWLVTLSNVKADLGAAVSPGELRVVPFAYDGTPGASGTTSSSLFGNTPDPVETTPVAPATTVVQVFNPVIATYTVPAFVSPVNFNIGAPSNIVADNTVQTVGDITIAETNAYSLQNGTYTVAVTGATVQNTAASPIKVTGTGFTATATPPETVVKAGTATQIQFTIAGALNTTKVSVKISGLLLATGTKGPISYTLTGGSVAGANSTFLPPFAGDSTLIIANPTPPPANVVDLDSLFVTAGDVNQTDIAVLPLKVDAAASPIAFRIGGIDRYQTAEKIALTNGSNDVIVLASGQDFPDALSSAYLANQFGASILLTKKTSLPASTVEGMRLLGTKTVYIIGGTGAISAGVEAQLRATSQYLAGGTVTLGQGKLQVVRLGGLDRYATNRIVNIRAAALSTDANPVGRTSIKFGQASKLTALVATGFDFADAMAGGPATAGNGSGRLPLILTRSTSLDPNARSQMTSLGIKQAVVLGGTGAVSASVATAIEGAGAAVYRIGGLNRFETATMVADFEIAAATPTATVDGGLDFNADKEGGSSVFLARGDDFADALAGAPLAAGQLSPILLTAPTALSPATATWLTDNAANYNFATALGLGGAVSSAVLDAANAALAG